MVGLLVGIDMVSISRISRLSKKEGFLKKILHSKELDALSSKTSVARRNEFIAGRYAAKEAMLKALGTGLTGRVKLIDIVVLTNETSGAPNLSLEGGAKEVAEEMRISFMQLSLSHEGDLAIAVAVLAEA